MTTAMVIGANGGIGAALVAGLAGSGRYTRIIAAARRAPAALPDGVDYHPIDLADPASIEAAAARIDAPLTRVNRFPAAGTCAAAAGETNSRGYAQTTSGSRVFPSQPGGV